MANQSQPRPWYRLASLARPVQPPGPPPAPTPRPLMLPRAALLPRPPMVRPTFRPSGTTTPQPGLDTAPPLQPPRPRALPPPPPAVTPASVAPPLSTPVAASPLRPSKSLPSIATTSPISQKSRPTSPVTQKSPLASPVSQKSPLDSPVSQISPRASPVLHNSPHASAVSQKSPLASPDTHKYPSTSKEQQISSTIPSASSLPPSPKPRTQSPPPSFLFSPVIKQEVAQSVPPPKSAVPMPSPREAKPLPETPPESPKIKSSIRSPPLFSLPPSQSKSDGEYERNIPAVAEQKRVLHSQGTIGKPRSFLNPYGDNSEIKRISNSKDIGMRVITISGENRGVIMELGYPPRTHGNPHKPRSDGELSDGNPSVNDGRSKEQGRNHNARVKASTPMHEFMNSNVQGINSSIVVNSTLSHHDPGVHLSLSRNPVKGHLKGHSNGHNFVQKEKAHKFSD